MIKAAPKTPATCSTLILFAIIAKDFNEMVEAESCDEAHAAELRAEFKSRLKDWGEGFKLEEVPGCFSRDGITYIPAAFPRMRRTILLCGFEREKPPTCAAKVAQGPMDRGRRTCSRSCIPGSAFCAQHAPQNEVKPATILQFLEKRAGLPYPVTNMAMLLGLPLQLVKEAADALAEAGKIEKTSAGGGFFAVTCYAVRQEGGAR